MALPPPKNGLVTRKFFNLPLKLELMSIYGLFMVGLTVFSSILINLEVNHANQHQADTIGELISGQTASAAANMLVTGDRLSLSVLLNQLVLNPYISEASIYSIDNRRMGHAVSKNASGVEAEGLVYSSPINYQDVIAGYVRLYLNQTLLTQKPKEAIQVIIAVSIVLLIIGLILLYFFSNNLVAKILLVERQLSSIFPKTSSLSEAGSEIDRVAILVEQQLTDKSSIANEAETHLVSEEIAAIVSIRIKNISRLKQLLAPQDLMNIIRLQMDITAEAGSLYEGSLSYSPEGNAYLRFVSTESDGFAMDALCCGLLIDKLSQRAAEQSIAAIQLGLGICLNDNVSEFPEEQHPALIDSAASQALMLASLPDEDGLHMLKAQLSWLPADITDIEVSEHGDDIVLINAISESDAAELERQADVLEASLLG